VAANAGALGGAVPTLLDAVTGIVTGGVLVALVGGVKRVVGGGAKKA
jgi:predicted DNA repair protein MutK